MTTPLRAWMQENHVSVAALARQANTSWITVSRYESGASLASNTHDLSIVRRISEATGGAVSSADILGLGAKLASSSEPAADPANSTPPIGSFPSDEERAAIDAAPKDAA